MQGMQCQIHISIAYRKLATGADLFEIFFFGGGGDMHIPELLIKLIDVFFDLVSGSSF